MRVDVRDLGASGTGEQLDTAAIQGAIDRCAATGGVVYLGPGRYLSGGLHLRSGVQLYLEAGARLLASTNPQDYEPNPEDTHDRRSASAFFLMADHVQDVGLAGPGVIDGQTPGDIRRGAKGDELPAFRVALIRFDDCQDVRLRDLTIRDADFWTVHLRHCDRVWIDGLAIRNNPHRRNSDGIDPDGCRNVHISNCHIVAGDDCIVLKTTKPGRPMENVVVSNCTMETTATAIKLGTESQADFRDIHVSNCVVRNSSSGIGFFVKDGATVERVSFSHLSMEDRDDDPIMTVACAVFMDIERRDAHSKVGAIRDISFSDLQIAGRTGFLIQGMPESPIQNLTLRDVALRVEKPMDYQARMKRVGGRRSTSDDRDTRFARQEAYVTLAYVQGLAVDNLRVDVSPAVFAQSQRSALSLHHVSDAVVRQVRRRPAGTEADRPLVNAEDCPGLVLADGPVPVNV